MTSKNLFFNIGKEDRKQKIWVISLSMLVFFLLFTIQCLLFMQNAEEPYLSEWFADFMSPNNTTLIIITVVGAVICGLSGFSFLFSKQKVDFYHGLPLKRNKLFWTFYINGILYYLLPLLINYVFCFIIGKIYGADVPNLVVSSLLMILTHLLCYLLIYNIVICIVMLTGNMVLAVVGVGISFVYKFIVEGVIVGYYNIYFSTFYNKLYTEQMNLGNLISPLQLYKSLIFSQKDVSVHDLIILLLAVFILSVLSLGFAFFLYQKRPSESAGKAVAFSKGKPILKWLFILPGSLGGGLIFKTISNGSNIWAIFGIVFSLLLFHAIVQIIFEFDFRAAVKGKRLLLPIGICALGVFSIFKFDLFQYDKYIPKQDQLQSAALSISGMLEEIYMYEEEIDIDTEKSEDKIFYLQNLSEEETFKKMKLTDFTTLYPLLEAGIKNAKQPLVKYYRESLRNTEQADDFLLCSIQYTFKNGKKVYRNYQIEKKVLSELLPPIYNSIEYKEGAYPVYHLEIDKIKSIELKGNEDSRFINLTPEEKREFFSIYKEEFSALPLEKLVESSPKYQIKVLIEQKRDNAKYMSEEEFLLYDECIKSIQYLENK